MYTVYINDRPLRLLPQEVPSPPTTRLTARYTGKRKSLLNYADMLEKGSPKVTAVDLVHDDIDALWEDFRSHYRWLPAAGGLVTNTRHERELFIFRRGYWDLPKGKIDEGETPEQAALREVREETGLEELTLGEALPTTYHTYRGRKNRILKPTYWFRMTTTQGRLRPETAEDIERAEWLTAEAVLRSGQPIYANLRALLEGLDGLRPG